MIEQKLDEVAPIAYEAGLKWFSIPPRTIDGMTVNEPYMKIAKRI